MTDGEALAKAETGRVVACPECSRAMRCTAASAKIEREVLYDYGTRKAKAVTQGQATYGTSWACLCGAEVEIKAPTDIAYRQIGFQK